MPRTIEYKGQQVQTGIYKQSTDAALGVRRLNIAGDAQGTGQIQAGYGD